MTDRDEIARERRLDALSASERHVRDRLHTLRAELNDLIRVIDRAVMRAGEISVVQKSPPTESELAMQIIEAGKKRRGEA
jgi:hypothetical protein